MINKIWKMIRLWQTVTVWETKTESGWSHNHIELGYNESVTSPTPLCDSQAKAWKGKEWRNVKATMNRRNVVKT